MEQIRAEENLKVYTKKLERSNRDLEEFAYMASHDLQEPLRKVQTFSDRLAVKYSQLLDEQGHLYLERMQDAVVRMRNLINDLLSLSRITTRANPFDSVSLNQIVSDVLSILETRIEQLHAKIEVSDLITLDCDPSQMRQLFQNLIGNALKFQRKNEPPAVYVYGEIINDSEKESLASEGLKNQFYRIYVKDNGIGFDPKYKHQIFEVFHRLHSRDSYEGTGIGLTICRKIIERHGGTISAEAKLNEGATFIVELPVKQTKEKIDERI
jgi:light-regulated signal transduction histidine kinase (bacteriophytochrome)